MESSQRMLCSSAPRPSSAIVARLGRSPPSGTAANITIVVVSCEWVRSRARAKKALRHGDRRLPLFPHSAPSLLSRPPARSLASLWPPVYWLPEACGDRSPCLGRRIEWRKEGRKAGEGEGVKVGRERRKRKKAILTVLCCYRALDSLAWVCAGKLLDFYTFADRRSTCSTFTVRRQAGRQTDRQSLAHLKRGDCGREGPFLNQRS